MGEEMFNRVNKARAFELARQTMRYEMTAIGQLSDGLDERFWVCARLLCECPGLIWVTGVGTSGNVGARFAHILTDCGVRSMFLSPADGLHGHTGVLASGDLLVVMSRGGGSSEVIQMAEIAKGRGVTTIAFVHNVESALAKVCQHVLPIQSDKSFELMGYVATTSTVAFSAMCDALSAVVLEEKGYTSAQLGSTHPGGAVGQALSPGQAD